jgi:hypothetical protein
MSWKLWLDDQVDTVRPIPNDSFIPARSSKEAIDLIEKLGPPSFIDFDFDLGNGDTAEVVYKYLGENYYDHHIDYAIHSENVMGRKMIQSYMESWKKSKL